ncbi:uncharacterized protein LOC100833242 isoform X2 [Brachypodium distachyon]|uniref:Uncharacterized protein n=1 Tax=Brachypodium distachyon TaxID=15368 RepID=A0A0Q3EDQ3_BRADI|nr:uncharacterized protein LOC100833242 isoform X2 [Brachypodium distachyon]KQJ84580.1 hypothetical protein BRADI_5g21705v3 [Brachypodium distachyon]|eukprot:XP_010227266.2 uncharacterized protein LOC100833242 isoform X2 [Brachypodium distachyon]
MPLPYMAVDVDESDCRVYTGPEEYPCVRRYRHRRLVAFLLLNGFRNTFTSLIQETDVFMSVMHLQLLVEQGLWGDALGYLLRFLQPTTCRQSQEALLLLHFVHMHQNLANIDAGNKDDSAVRQFTERYKHYASHASTVCHGAVRIHSIVLSILHSEELRASLDWKLVRCKAAVIVDELAYKVPELKHLVLMPAGRLIPQYVLPLGFGLASFRPRRRVKKQQWRSASALAKHYREYKLRMPSSSHQELHHGLSSKARSRLADLLDESLKAGRRAELRQRHPLQVTAMESPPFNQATFGILTRPATTSGISSAMNAGTAALQTSSAKTSGIASVTNADTDYLTREGSYTESACQGSVSREDQRRARIAFVKKFLNTKRQASREPLVDVKVEAGWPAGAGTSTD